MKKLPINSSAGCLPSALAGVRELRRAVALTAGLSLLGAAHPVLAGSGDFSKSITENPPAESPWEFSITGNGWGPWVEINTPGGTEIDLGLDDIAKNLQGIVETGVGIRKDKWSLFTDIIWVKLGFDDLGPVDDLDIEEWLVTPKLGYRAFEGDWGYVDLQAGVRYTWVDIEIEGSRGILDEEGSADIWDFLVGFTGHYNINEKWYIPFMVEVGAGDSDFVGAFFAGIGYHFESVDVYLGFKYLTYEFGDSAPLDDETAYGPMLSVKYTF